MAGKNNVNYNLIRMGVSSLLSYTPSQGFDQLVQRPSIQSVEIQSIIVLMLVSSQGTEQLVQHPNSSDQILITLISKEQSD